jgi:predicted nucleic acid binding AN1-type Zn finger protein
MVICSLYVKCSHKRMELFIILCLHVVIKNGKKCSILIHSPLLSVLVNIPTTSSLVTLDLNISNASPISYTVRDLTPHIDRIIFSM